MRHWLLLLVWSAGCLLPAAAQVEKNLPAQVPPFGVPPAGQYMLTNASTGQRIYVTITPSGQMYMQDSPPAVQLRLSPAAGPPGQSGYQLPPGASQYQQEPLSTPGQQFPPGYPAAGPGQYQPSAPEAQYQPGYSSPAGAPYQQNLQSATGTTYPSGYPQGQMTPYTQTALPQQAAAAGAPATQAQQQAMAEQQAQFQQQAEGQQQQQFQSQKSSKLGAIGGLLTGALGMYMNYKYGGSMYSGYPSMYGGYYPTYGGYPGMLGGSTTGGGFGSLLKSLF